MTMAILRKPGQRYLKDFWMPGQARYDNLTIFCGFIVLGPIGAKGIVRHAEVVKEVTSEPDYAAALKVVGELCA